MQGESWRDGDLSMQTVASAIDVPMHRLSQLINQEYGCNFFQFVNRFRLRAACAMLEDPASAHYTILEIAYQSGFNSKSAFNAVFKERIGTTPRRYRERARADG